MNDHVLGFQLILTADNLVVSCTQVHLVKVQVDKANTQQLILSGIEISAVTINFLSL